MRMLALALFALCTANIAAIASKDASMDEQLAINAMLEAKVEALEATTTAQAGTNAAMCAAVEEIPVGVRPAALEKVCSGAKTTDIKLLGDGNGEGFLTPTTDAPTTDAPTTFAPTTLTPTTDAPTTDAPTTDAPITLAPITLAPTTLALGGCQNNQSYCTINEAKCAGTGQNNTLVEGRLDCELNPKFEGNTGSACIDNLSTGKVHSYQDNWVGHGVCKSFNSDWAIFGVTESSSEKNTTTKLMLAHPHKADKNIGVFAMKRMLCDDGGCSVFKAGYCVKCPGDVFESWAQMDATPKELGEFFDCCVMGQSTYRDTEERITYNCPSGWTAGAFTSPDGSPSNDPLATIRADYACNDTNAEKAMLLMKAM